MYNPIEALTPYTLDTVGGIRNYNVELGNVTYATGLDIFMKDYYGSLRLSALSGMIDGLTQTLQCAGALVSEFSRLLEYLLEARELAEKNEIYLSQKAAAWIEKEFPGLNAITADGNLNKIDLERLSAEELEEVIQKLLDWINNLLAAVEAKNAEMEKMIR